MKRNLKGYFQIYKIINHENENGTKIKSNTPHSCTHTPNTYILSMQENLATAEIVRIFRVTVN